MGNINSDLIKNDSGKIIARMKIKSILSDEERIWRRIPSSWCGGNWIREMKHINNFMKTQIEYNGSYKD